MGDGNLHRHSDLPCLMAGKLGGAFKTGRHMRYPLDTPMSNLLLTMLDKAGVPHREARRQHGPAADRDAVHHVDPRLTSADVGLVRSCKGGS